MRRPVSAPRRPTSAPTRREAPAPVFVPVDPFYVSTYVRDYTPKQGYRGGRRMTAADFQGMPVPYASDGADTPTRFVSATHQSYKGHDLSSAWMPRRGAFDFQGRPTPYALDKPDPGRFVSATHAGYPAPDLNDAWLERAAPFDFQGRPIPYALDYDSNGAAGASRRPDSGRYVSAAQRQFRECALGDGKPPARARAPAGAGLPYALDLGADGEGLSRDEGSSSRKLPGEWSTTHRSHYVSKDIVAARPSKLAHSEFDYNP